MKRPHSSSKNLGDRTSEVAAETDAARARAIVASLRTHEPSSEEVFEAFWELDALPVNDVREAFTSWLGPLPDPDRLDPATRLAHGFPPPRLRLRTISVVRDADLLDLGPIAEAQLRIAGTTWDGADLAPEDRLDGEIEGSLAGTLERRVLADVNSADGAPLFDVLLFAEDSGVVFASGTTTVIALIAYRKVETRDRRVRTAVEEALAAPAIVAPIESVAATSENASVASAKTVTAKIVTPKTIPAKAIPAKAIPAKAIPAKAIPAKTVAATKTTAKKAATTKTAAKKQATKKAAITKTVAKKTAAKKAVTKKPAGKKAAAKSTATKKPAAKKTATKKRAAKKTAIRKNVRRAR